MISNFDKELFEESAPEPKPESTAEVTPQAAFEVANVITEPLSQHQLTLAESGSVLVMTQVGGCAITLMPNLPVGFNVAILSLNGDSSLNVGSGVLLNGATATKTVKQGYSGVSLLVIEPNKFAAGGNVGP